MAAAMDELAELSDGIEADLRHPSDGATAAASARRMAALFEELIPLHEPRYGGDAERWRVACEQGRDLAFALGDRLAAGDWAAARQMASQSTALKLSAHRTFRPGFWRRFRQIFNPASPGRPSHKINQGDKEK